jgi:hypothetical protein
MASLLSFASLVEAIARSVAQAQDEVERHQVRNLLDYFDKDGRPRGIDFRVPSRRSDAKPGDEDFYSVPLLALVSINVLKIKEVDIRFSVDMGELTEEPGAARDATAPPGVEPKLRPGEPDKGGRMAGFAGPMKTLNVSTVIGPSGGKVRVALRVEGSQPSEGAARLLDYLAQMQGIYPELNESTPDANDQKEKQ